MDAYILGTHEGDLPVHLLEQGEFGNRVRVMATLSGPAHNVYYALEAPTQQVLDEHVSTVTSTGTKPGSLIVPCTTVPCHIANDGVGHQPSFLPPWVYHLFLVLHAESIEHTIPAVIERLGLDHVAAVNDGNGTFLVQFAGDDMDELEAATGDFLNAAGGEHSGLHAVTGGLIKA